MAATSFPASQGELIRAVRGNRSQVEFARELRVHASCLSRYEREELGAPTLVINHCLQAFATSVNEQAKHTPVQRALLLTRQAVGELERVEKVAPTNAAQRGQRKKKTAQRQR